MNYGAEYGDRVKHLGERNQEDVVVPLSELPVLYARLGKKNPAAEHLADQLYQGDASILPSEFFVADGDGIGINISSYKKTGMTRRLSQIEGALSLFRDLHRDATLRGEKTLYTEGFREARRETQQKNADLIRTYIFSGVDREDELATEGNLAQIESPEAREAFKHIESFAQSITDRLFVASGIKKFKPKVYVTKSETVNAFVLTQDTGNAFKEYVASATDDQPMELPIFIHTGLVRAFKTEDELAGVLAHEFAHLLQPNYIDDNDESLQKRLEYDADAQGMRLADAAGFNPRGLIDVMKTFNRGSGSALDIIMSSSHPATEKRIIELEKLFHRTDLPLPNAVKSMTPYSEQLGESLETTKKRNRLRERALPIHELEEKGELEKSLKGMEADPAAFLYSHNGSLVETVAETRTIEAYRDYELVTGDCGYRDHLLQSLDGFLAAMKKAKADGLAVSIEIPFIGKTILDISMPSAGEVTFTTSKDIASHRIADYQKKNRQDSEKYMRSRMGIETEDTPARTLEQWISDNGDTAVFWEEVQKKFGFPAPLTQGQKLFCLRSWLKDDNQGYTGYQKFRLTKTVEKVERIPKMPDSSNVSILNNVPLIAGRVHRKKEEEILPEVEFTETKTYQTEEVWVVNVEKEPRLDTDIWKRDADTAAPVIRELASVHQERTALSYQALLRERGFGELSIEAARYITRSINRFKQHGPLFEDAEQKSIIFFDEVIRAAEFQKLSNLGKDGFGGDNNLQWLKKTCIAAIGFLLVPRTQEEKNLQQQYLQRLETDPMLWFKKDFSMELSVLPEDGSVSDRHIRAQKKQDGDIYIFQSENLAGMAMQERVLVENSDLIEQYTETGDFNGEASPSWFAYCQEKPMKKGQLRDSLFGQKDIAEAVRRAADRDDRHLDVIEEKMNRLIDLLSGLSVHMYRSEAATMSQVKEQFADHKKLFEKGRDKGTWEFFAPIIREYAKKFVEELAATSVRFRKRLEEDNRSSYGLHVSSVIENILWRALRDQYTYQDVLKQIREIKMVEQKKNVEVSDDSIRFLADSPEEALAGCVYRPKNRQVDEIYTNLQGRSVLSYLEQEAKMNPAMVEIHKELSSLIKKQKEVGPAVLMLALGQLPPYEDFLKKKHAIPVPETIRLFRRAAEIYGSEWQHLERFKRLDEQLSLWEWKYSNPLFFDTYSVPDEDRYGKQKDVPLPVFIEKTLEHVLQGIYQIDQNYLDKQKFSWPLFLQDVYDGQLDMKKIVPSHLDEKEKTRVEQALVLLKKRLEEAVADPNNLEKVKGMQPGFFKEFILNEKMKRMGVATLEEMEPFLDQFSAFTHEGSKRNQLEGIIEQSKKDLIEKRKKELCIQVCHDMGLTEQQADVVLQAVNAKGYLALSDRDIEIWPIGWPVSHKEFYDRFQELLKIEEERIEARERTPEEDVFVFSDQIIEHEKSKLEIGPVYRLRWASQPLMEWHTAALEQASTPEEGKKAFARVEKIIPEQHPVKDVFVKNQLAMDIWHILKSNGTNPEELGFSIKKKTVHIVEALKAYPLHAEASFLKEYSLFEVDGLLEHPDRIPEALRDEIIQTIETALEQRISPDQHPALRRMLFVLEQKLQWPQLKKERKSDSGVFDRYIARIEHFYPQPSFEKDDILEKIGMDLAYTPEQIKAVWNLRYEEQTRWATETESATKKTVLEGVERTRLSVSRMETFDRVQYLLWTLGGKIPLVELLSSDITNISLDQRKNALWMMNQTERRHALYELFMGEKGIMQTGKNEPADLFSDELTDAELPKKRQEKANKYRFNNSTEDVGVPHTLPRMERPSDRIRYVADNIFEQTFGNQALDPDLPNEHPTNVRGRELLHTIFRELFLQQKDVARRTELMINIVEAVGKNKHEGKSLTPGELMKLLLEQIGVVGVKVAQVLSEQPGLLPESIQRELATLKDQAATFSKRGILAYLEAGGWVNSEDSKMETIGDCIGSASIKQVMEGKTRDGQIVAIKAKRPSIDKNFEDSEREEISNSDMAVLKRVLMEVEKKGFNVPSFLIPEVRNGVFEELSFTHEADNQMAMKASLAKRNASLRVPIGSSSVEIPLSISAPLSVSDILYPAPESKDDIGLMVEQYVRGLSLKQMQDYKRALKEGDNTVLNKMREKVTQLYDKTRVKDIENKIERMDVDMLQAQLAIDVLKQVTQDGVFHADLHGGNFYLDFNPVVEHGVLHEMRGVFIDLGSTGFSSFDAMPNYQKEVSEESFNAKEDFRDFITALFTIDIMQEGASRKIASLVKKYAGFDWKESDVMAVLSKSSETEGRVKSLFYGILEQKGDRPLQPQFRALLKTLATASSHFDKLKSVMLGDNPEALGITPEEMGELVNFDAIATA